MSHTSRGPHLKERRPLPSSEAMPRLSFVIPGDLASRTGGYEYDRRIIDGLRRAGWTVDVIALDGSFPRPTDAALADAERQFAALEPGQLVLADGLAFGAMPTVAERHGSRLRVVALVHHPLAFESGLEDGVAAQLLRDESVALAAAAHVVVTSARTACALASLGVSEERISVVVPGTDPVEACPQPSCPPRRLLCVGSVVPRKGHAVLIDALKRLRDLEWTLACVGSLTRSLATVEKLRQQIDAAGLGERVTLAGECGEAGLREAYASADLFVLPTLYEGYGMVVAEALARGLPVIASRTGAIEELVGEDAGVVVPPGDVEALTDALRRVLSDARFAHALGDGAGRRMRELPTWSDASRDMATVLMRVAR